MAAQPDGGEDQVARRMSEAAMGAAVLVVALAVAAWSQLATFLDPFVISEDARQHVYWMQRFREPGLFPDDLLARYSEHYQPWGYVVFYRVLAMFLDPLGVSRALPVLLSGATALVLYRTVSRLSDRFGGVFAAACFVATPEYMSRMSGAFPRGFAYLLLASFLMLLLERRYRALAVLLVVESLLYPVSFVVSAGTLALGCVVAPAGRPRVRWPERDQWPCVVAVAVGCVLLAAQFATERDPAIGVTVTRTQMEGAPEYGPRGRIKLLPGPSLTNVVTRHAARAVLPHGWPDLSMGTRPKLVTIAMLLGYLVVRVVRGRRAWPRVLIDFLVASVLCFFLAELVLMKLFLPSRYLEATVKLSVLIACTAASSDLANAARTLGANATRATRALLLLLPVLALPLMKDRGLQDRGEARALTEFLASLPPDTLIAAHPRVANDIPYFAARSVLVTYELAHPFYDAYWQTVKDRTRAVLAAHYARDMGEVDAFCTEYGVDVFVVDRSYYASAYLDGERLYFEPFEAELRALVSEPRNFVLLDVPEAERLFDSQDQFVVRCGRRR